MLLVRIGCSEVNISSIAVFTASDGHYDTGVSRSFYKLFLKFKFYFECFSPNPSYELVFLYTTFVSVGDLSRMFSV